MNSLLTIILFGLCFNAFGQEKRFESQQAYSYWIMNYYKQPEPQYLFNAFKYGAESKEIAKSGSRSNMMGFFASCLRHDTLQQSAFFSHVQSNSNKDLIYGFGMVLWYIHTESSLEKLNEFKSLKQVKKYSKDFELLMNSHYIDLWADSITHPDHLDLLWADFFATGNKNSIIKIISKLPDIDSNDYYDQVVAGAAKWSLTANSTVHDKVLDICKDQMDNVDEETKKILESIISDVAKH